MYYRTMELIMTKANEKVAFTAYNSKKYLLVNSCKIY